MVATSDNHVYLTVDIVLTGTTQDGVPHVLLIRRADDSDAYPGAWALPGGYVDAGERIENAVRRELAEETHITDLDTWQRIGIYDDPGRDPRGRVVSVAFAATLPWLMTPQPGDDASDAAWFPLADALSRDLAFDHRRILADARLITK